ncbi:DEAD-domain-containing protein [Mytilinidion resinicola]|uniref:RNA helicase n=1 Tax=Mytilinidion resinicola TaxID=574789 RepID=A0A6A6Z8V1_9PEZI|nr:DEAD-domain-containing protein [Mytilinidion resinicola]KAF2817551.1 DEAD-domain-containing protein [Mytilinidion resinicola]
MPSKDNAPSSVADSQLDGGIPQGKEPALIEPEYEVEVKLADMQADPNSPLFSVKSFEELNLKPELLRGIMEMNFRSPSKIQERALPLLLHNPPQNMIAQSQSGTGKTAAFSLNMLTRIDLNNLAPQALVLAPSRELARQILGVIQHMGQFMEGLVVTPAIPDPTHRNKKFEGQIIVGTPGTVMDMVRRKYIDSKQLQILVLDEADNMLDQQGLGDQCKRVKQMLPRNIQTVLFSATFPHDVLDFAQLFAPKANQITLKHEELTIEGIKQLYLDCDGLEDKFAVLLKFYGLMTTASSIIFVRTRATAAQLEHRMVAEGHTVAQLSGGLEGPERDIIIDKFRNGEAKVLITTNVLARGIDVQSVTMVINYDIPTHADGSPDPETYLHRIGRTGRFGRVGVALSFVHDRGSWQALADIAAHFKTDLIAVDHKDWDSVEKMVKKVIRSSRAGKSTKDMNNQMQMDGSADD